MCTIDHSTTAIRVQPAIEAAATALDDLMASMAVMDRTMKQSHDMNGEGGREGRCRLLAVGSWSGPIRELPS